MNGWAAQLISPASRRSRRPGVGPWVGHRARPGTVGGRTAQHVEADATTRAVVPRRQSRPVATLLVLPGAPTQGALRRDRDARVRGLTRPAHVKGVTDVAKKKDKRDEEATARRDDGDGAAGGDGDRPRREDESQGVRARDAPAPRRARRNAGVGEGHRREDLHRVRGSRHRRQGRHHQADHRAGQPAHLQGRRAVGPDRAARSRRCTSSATSSISRPQARS